MGVSPATGPTPNKGFEAAGLQQLGMIVKQLERLIPLLGSGSEAGGAALKALNSLAKFVPSGSVTPTAEKQMAEQAQMKATQNNQQMQALKAQGGGGGGGGRPPSWGGRTARDGSMNIFESKETMPLAKEVVSTAMVREETPIGTPRLSGEVHWPERNVEKLIRPRRGHGY
jgi:hypothetical protein